MSTFYDIKKFKNIHMIGIGGVSMSGIAEILAHWNYNVTGSDLNHSTTIDRLIKNNVKVTIGHNLEDIAKSDAVVYSAAIKPDDIEFQEAKRLNIPTIERADFLGEITKIFKDTIAISGTHGKTTTTSMISVCFLEANMDPNIQVGGILKEINSNYRIGNSEYFILEACEYVESFLKFRPKSEIILNIDNDHLDYFKNFENIKNAFIKYVKLIPDDGLLVFNADDNSCLELVNHVNCKYVTYGIANSDADFVAQNIIFDTNGFPRFDVFYKKELWGNFKLSVPGVHNVLNALACISLCNSYGISIEKIKSGLLKFSGAGRRLEYKGTFNGATVYDDYAHHPTEITATANAISNKQFNKSWVIFQPHTYSRTKNLLKEFATALLPFDNIIITDIYAAREHDTYGVSSRDLVNEIKRLNKDAIYIQNFSEIVDFVKNNIEGNDILVTLGAGTVTDIGPMLLSK